MFKSDVIIKIFLIFSLSLLSACTEKLWTDYYDRNSFVKFYGEGFSVLVLNKNEIAILASRNSSYSGRHSQGDESYKQFRNLAYIYKFKESDYIKIEEDIESVFIEEEVEISIDKRDIIGKSGKFIIKLIDGSEISPEFVDLTMTDSRKNEIVFTDPKIKYVRKVNVVGKELDDDLSFLYRVPLTPVTVAVDASAAVVVPVVGAAVIIPFLAGWALLCNIQNDPCH